MRKNLVLSKHSMGTLILQRDLVLLGMAIGNDEPKCCCRCRFRLKKIIMLKTMVNTLSDGLGGIVIIQPPRGGGTFTPYIPPITGEFYRT